MKNDFIIFEANQILEKAFREFLRAGKLFSPCSGMVLAVSLYALVRIKRAFYVNASPN